MKLLDVSLIPLSPPRYGAQRRIQGIQSHERRFFSLPALRRALAGLLSRRRYDIVNVEHDGVTFTSAPDEAHARALVPSGDSL
jgi:hypothetical protein